MSSKLASLSRSKEYLKAIDKLNIVAMGFAIFLMVISMETPGAMKMSQLVVLILQRKVQSLKMVTETVYVM